MAFLDVVFPFWSASAWLYRRLRDKPSLRAGSVSASAIPTATEGKAIPVVFGKVKITPNIVWAQSDITPEPIQVDGTTVGFKYFEGMHYVVAMGLLDSVDAVFFDDKRVAFNRLSMGSSYDQLTFNLPALFGEDGGVPDGISGAIDFYFGGTTQSPNDYMQAAIGANLPAYRNVATAVMRGMYIGNSPYLRPIAFEVSRYPKMGAGDTTGFQARVDDDSNPANIIYDILTNTIWGCGVDPALIDIGSFQQARQWMVIDFVDYKKLGMSFILDDSTPATNVIQDVLRHINGTLYFDPFIGKYRLALIRTNYPSPAGPGPTFNESNADDIEVTTGSEADIANVIRVHYIDRGSNYGARVAQVQDLASIDALGGQRIVEDVDFMGFSTALQAQKAAARELRERAYPLKRCRFVAHREAWTPKGPVNPWTPTYGAPFVLDHPNATIALFRITNIDSGTLTDGRVVVEGVEDVFNVDWIASGAPVDSDWIDPYSVPGNTAARWIEEAPLTMNYVAIPFTPYLTKLLCYGAKGAGGQMLGMDVYNSGTGFTYPGVIPESPTATLVAALTNNSTTIVVGSGNAPMASLVEVIDPIVFNLGGTLALIVDESDPDPLAAHEIIAYSAISYNVGTGQYTLTGVVRGCVDTTPRPHSAGQRLWFYTTTIYPEWGRLSPTAWFQGDSSYNLKLIPFGPGGSCPIASATTISQQNNRRALRPWLPCNIRLEGALYPTTYTGDLSITWLHRNRFEEGALHSDANKSPSQTIEPGMVYRIRFYLNGSASVARTVDNLTGVSHTYTAAEQSTDNGGSPPTTVRVLIDAHPSGSFTYVSWREYDHTVTRV